MMGNRDKSVCSGEDDEPSTWVRIQRGTVIDVTRSSWPAMVAIDGDATPLVTVPEIRPSSMRPPPMSRDLSPDEETTHRLLSADPALPKDLLVPSSPSWTERAARIARVAALTAGAVALLIALQRRHGTSIQDAQPSTGTASPETPTEPIAAPHAPPVALASVAAAHAAPIHPPAQASPSTTAARIAPIAPAAGVSQAAPAPTPTGKTRGLDSLLAAHESLAHQRYDEARAGYDAVLARDPANVEATAGLGDIARAQGQRARAASFYDHALALAPSYVPARVGRADLLWEAGDRARSLIEYRALAESSPRVPPYVTARLAAADAAEGNRP